MSNLLSREEYRAIAAGLKIQTQSFIGGEFRPAQSGRTLPTINPATGEVLAEIAACGSEDVDFAVKKPAKRSKMVAGAACIRAIARKFWFGLPI